MPTKHLRQTFVTSTITDTVRPARPWTLWGFSLIVALLGGYNLALALDHVRRADEMHALHVAYPPLLRAGFALAWGAILLWAAWGLARRKRRARRWLLVILSNYGAFSVLWLVMFARSDYSRGRIAFQAVAAVGLVLLAGTILRWRRVRRAFAPVADELLALPETPSEAHSGDVPL